jgi:hypothetical protein
LIGLLAGLRLLIVLPLDDVDDDDSSDFLLMGILVRDVNVYDVGTTLGLRSPILRTFSTQQIVKWKIIRVNQKHKDIQNSI